MLGLNPADSSLPATANAFPTLRTRRSARSEPLLLLTRCRCIATPATAAQDPHRGKFINPPISPPENEVATEADTVSHAVSPETASYPIENFRSVTVSNSYVSVDTTLWTGVLVAVSTALLAHYILLKTNPHLKRRHQKPTAT